MQGFTAQELLQKELPYWKDLFRSIRGDRLKWPPGFESVELHDIAVLRHIMEYSGFERDPEPFQHCFDDTISTEEKLHRLSHLFDMGVIQPALGSKDLVGEAFSQARVSEEGSWESVRKLVSRLVPGFS
jgi:hypothetical protein